MATIFVDECGYTGPDFCDPAQPIFVLASHDFSEDEAKALKARFFGWVRTSLKYSRLSKRPSQQRMIIEFLDHVNTQRERIMFTIVHKRFAMVCKAVDLITEPVMHRDKVDLYDKGGNLALANLIHYVTLTVGGVEYHDKLVQAIQKFLRTPNAQSYDDLIDLLDEKTKLHSEGEPTPVLGEVLKFFHLPLLQLDRSYVESLSGKDIDVSFTMALTLMAEWSQKYGGDMTVIHDQSSNMSKQRGEWDKVVSPDVPPAIIGMDRRTRKFPIGVKSTEFAEDEMWAGLQIADVLAGAMEDALRTLLHNVPPPDAFTAEVAHRFVDWPLTEPVWPENKTTPSELGTIGPKYADPIKFMQNLVEERD